MAKSPEGSFARDAAPVENGESTRYIAVKNEVVAVGGAVGHTICSLVAGSCYNYCSSRICDSLYEQNQKR